MKKLMKRIGAVLMAVAMMAALGVTGAWAVDNKTISLGGLENGDTVTYYQVIEWSDVENKWVFKAPFDTVDAETQKRVIGYTDPTTKLLVNGAINSTDAATIATKATTTAAQPGGTVGSTKIWTKENMAPGLYMVQVVPNGTTDVVYNPVFLAIQKDNTGSELTLPQSYQGDSAKAKKSVVTVDKTSKSPDGETWEEATTEDVGSIVDFKVVTTIPVFLENYTNPVFTVKDTLNHVSLKTDGENLSAITVKVGETTLTEVAADTADPYNAETGDYYITGKSEKGYTVNFTKKYLQANAAVQTVTITYKAKITDSAKTVNPADNTVEIEYSHNPDNASDHGKKQDKTTHYTFSIDAGLFGDEQYESSEIVKVGVDAAGNPVTEEKTYHNGTKHNPLAGAKFKLYTDADCNQLYSNSVINAGQEFETSDTGKMRINGLDEGTYYLKESQAANGYALLTEPVKFIIKASYKEVAPTDECNAYKELDQYVVVAGADANTNYDDIVVGTAPASGTTSTYTMNNGTIVKDGQNHAGDQTYEIKNVKGQNLPSTGGIGTYVFTVAGVAIMAIAAGLLIVRHKKKA